MSLLPPGIPSLFRKYILHLFLAINILLISGGGIAAGAAKSIPGYAHGQNVPVSCLNRDISTGDHITDPAGKLQYIPFPTCNETSAPLSFHYGVSETITCTIHSLSDPLYHLLEYYVHADVPLTCRIPTFPLLASPPSPEHGSTVSPDRKPRNSNSNINDGDSSHEETHDDATSSFPSQPPFTPLTIALQGTLQLSHLHIWTDINVLMHRSARLSAGAGSKNAKKAKKDNKKKKKGKKNKDDKNNRWGTLAPLPEGQIVAGSAYSVPMVVAADDDDYDDKEGADKLSRKQREMMMEPWAMEGGTKVIRGEPLVFTFRVGWISGGDVLGLVNEEKSRSSSSSLSMSGSSLLIRLMTICFWVGIGLGLGVVVDRVRRRRGMGGVYKGDGILGHRPFFGVGGNGGVSSGGDRGRMNGYGFGMMNGNGNGSGGGYGGYGGYSLGKKD
ncbi:hypothetical protein AJ78_03581 [Emergomyces pasteurianus Ep9510]|uniref:Uncharacterized protein n=1 Tax=Emergomyces pasteurianus Ep9510 TaxID=1447872 RepID=A0A1J9QK20_9EURO|nr:hypothetical protein AJ78_03581 [Emergomyces pasteurianus Ep9510]